MPKIARIKSFMVWSTSYLLYLARTKLKPFAGSRIFPYLSEMSSHALELYLLSKIFVVTRPPDVHPDNTLVLLTGHLSRIITRTVIPRGFCEVQTSKTTHLVIRSGNYSRKNPNQNFLYLIREVLSILLVPNPRVLSVTLTGLAQPQYTPLRDPPLFHTSAGLRHCSRLLS